MMLLLAAVLLLYIRIVRRALLPVALFGLQYDTSVCVCPSDEQAVEERVLCLIQTYNIMRAASSNKTYGNTKHVHI